MDNKCILLDVTHMPTLKRRCNCEKAVLIMMDRMSLPPRRASANSPLVPDVCPSTNGVANTPL